MEQRTLLFATPDSELFDRVDWQLCGEMRITLLSQARNESDVLRLVRAHRPDVVLLDFGAFADNAILLIDRISTLQPGTRSLLFAEAWTEHAVLHALKNGSSGCIQIDGPRSELLGAIDAVQRGEIWVSRRTLAIAFRQLLRAPGQSAPNGLQRRLSAREREIVDWMRRGMSNKEIARELGISDMTVKTHVHNIFHKLEVSGRVRLLGMPPPAIQQAWKDSRESPAEPIYRLPVTICEDSTQGRA